MSRYLVQYRVLPGDWKTYSRHNKPERANETATKIRRRLLVGGVGAVRVVNEVNK